MIVVILAIGGGVAFLLSTSADQEAKQKMADTGAKVSIQDIAPDQNVEGNGAGSYIDYSQSAIADTAGTKLLFFYAPWCPQCRALESDIKTSGVPKGVTVIKVDYDTNQQLRQKYGVTIQTTVVRIDDSGNLTKKYVAYDEPSIDSVIKNLF